MVKNLPAVRETRVQSLGREDPLEKRMGTHSSVLVWRIPWTEKPGGPQSMGLQRVGHDWSNLTCMHTHNRSIISLLQEWGSQTTVTQSSLSLDGIYFLVLFSKPSYHIHSLQKCIIFQAVWCSCSWPWVWQVTQIEGDIQEGQKVLDIFLFQRGKLSG